LTAILSPLVTEIVAIDASEKMIKGLCQRHPLLNVIPLTGLLTAELIQDNLCLQTNFDLIIASSVCGFLPDYPGTLHLLRSLLAPDGIFVQWDWVDQGEGFGVSETRATTVLTEVGFPIVSIGIAPFRMSFSEDPIPVLIAVGRNSNIRTPSPP
jgi:2-polyprenyl-3-methyl-5-hydroxy-6-metoxy-1,4-benzoquinol methylase